MEAAAALAAPVAVAEEAVPEAEWAPEAAAVAVAEAAGWAGRLW